jgi:spore photoproduct lyase
MTMTVKISKALSEGLKNSVLEEDLKILEHFEVHYGFSLQELKHCATWLIDCRMWHEFKFIEKVLEMPQKAEAEIPQRQPKQKGEWIFNQLRSHYLEIQAAPRKYGKLETKEFRPNYRYEDHELRRNFFHTCPAISRSEAGVCCDLKVLDVVENCALGCTYCALQHRYEEDVIEVPVNLKQRLTEIELDPNQRYRIGTGQSSDALLWGNRNGILDDLMDFTRKNPNIILEMKTKSPNVGYFLEHDNLPANICPSWSLNPQAVIDNEEHGTASLEHRLAAARKVADRGIRVGFHLHPMMYFEGWETAYRDLIERVIALFKPEEVLWFTLGTITLIKGLDDDLRKLYHQTKLLQMATETTPDNKITYAENVREALYMNAVDALSPWQNKVIVYMCMEHKPMWNKIMGFHYNSFAEMNEAINASAFPKLFQK